MFFFEHIVIIPLSLLLFLTLSLFQNRRELVNQFGSSVPSKRAAINRIVTLRSIQRVYGWQGKAEMNDDAWMTAQGVGHLGPVIVNSSSIRNLYIYIFWEMPLLFEGLLPFWPLKILFGAKFENRIHIWKLGGGVGFWLYTTAPQISPWDTRGMFPDNVVKHKHVDLIKMFWLID